MTLYRILISLAAPFILAVAIFRMGGITARLGLVRPTTRATHLWLHAASNGELTSARPVITALQAAHPDLHILITTNSITGRDLARGWKDPKIAAHLAPIDLRWAIRRTIKTWRITALLIIENELWPNRIATVHAAGLPVAVVGARMSSNSAQTWQKLPKFAAQIIGCITWLSPQDTASAKRFEALGLAQSALQPTFNLKTLYQPPASDFDLTKRAPLYDRAKTILAASTHQGEDALILDAFAAAHAHDPALHLILAPRHPVRRDEIIKLIGNRFSFVQHSNRDLRGTDTQITLADTMGDMGLWYALSGICVVCGSFVAKGGHTPFEPAHFNCAILHGPHVENFAEVYAHLDREGAALCIETASQLADALGRLSKAEQIKMADLATAITRYEANSAPVFDSLVAALKPAP